MEKTTNLNVNSVPNATLVRKKCPSTHLVTDPWNVETTTDLNVNAVPNATLVKKVIAEVPYNKKGLIKIYIQWSSTLQFSIKEFHWEHSSSWNDQHQSYTMIRMEALSSTRGTKGSILHMLYTTTITNILDIIKKSWKVQWSAQGIREVSKVSDKIFKLIIFKIHDDLYENPMNEIRERMNDQNKKVVKK